VKILYAIQGTGNGHIARAEDVIPVLQQYGDLDLFVSGAQADIKLPYPIKFKSKGLSFFFGKSGGIDFYKTFKNNSSKEVYKEIKKFPVDEYDLVINDFEPITAWACKRREIPCVGLSHQSALLSHKIPTPKKIDPVGEWVIHNYAPVDKYVSFHFDRYDKDMFTPVIRSAVKTAAVSDKGHYTVYLPAYDDKKLVKLFLKFPQTKWRLFSKHINKPYHIGKISVFPVDSEAFSISMASANGVLCGAGFETPAEALFLRKKLMVVPMKNQYEQHFNAASLKQFCIHTIKKAGKKNLDKIEDWIEAKNIVEVNYKETARASIERVLKLHADGK